MKSPVPPLLLFLAAGCTSLGVDAGDLPIPRKEPEIVASEAATQSEPRLYARDGSVVSANEPGVVQMQDTLGHDLSPTNGGRMYILELYQKVIEERDALQLEINALRTDNERVRVALDESEQRVAELAADLDRARADRQSLLDENMELASRLTTAQIRRLEAERLLLETRIREAQATVAVQVDPVDAVDPAPAEKQP